MSLICEVEEPYPSTEDRIHVDAPMADQEMGGNSDKDMSHLKMDDKKIDEDAMDGDGDGKSRRCIAYYFG